MWDASIWVLVPITLTDTHRPFPRVKYSVTVTVTVTQVPAVIQRVVGIGMLHL